MSEFAGVFAVVTGAGSGIGAATARALAERGAERVYLLDVVEEAVDAVARDIPASIALAVDVSDPGLVAKAFDTVVADCGRIDVVVHAAGIDDPVSKQWIAEAGDTGEPVDVIGRLTDDMWRRVMAINLDGTFHVLREAVRVMRGRGGGSVVTVGSSSAFDTLIGYPHYSASKAAVHALTQSVAKEVLPFGIRVNTVAPGPVDTGMAARTPAPVRASMAAGPARGYASPEELADTILYLASAGAANVVGAVVLSNGGRFTV
ncbi:SDR family NAD(P)-dependent oxidoreductase [Gordonia sp. OPL2]|uniref:SDR family NAD(P)-dependent oxidoreductase n=1 Tax=Gordonia sp. OPL2 TaxID=2486274 RepID=UPI0021CCCF34|nr:SDR family NAD(P)-dependent oxidoreductase [Gordonia sp. OPL2]